MTSSAPAATQATTGTWSIDASHSMIEFAAKHMMITTVKGRLTDVSGSLVIDEAHPERS